MGAIGIYGGAFDPPHKGHIQGARFAAQKLDLSRLYLIPTCASPHKAAPQNTAPAQQRLHMLQLAIGEDPVLAVSDIELQRGGVSYTWQTVQQLRQQHPQDPLYLILGTDMFLSILNWVNPELILQQVTLAVLYRGDREETRKVAEQKAAVEAAGGKVVLLENPVCAISSTDLRRMLALQCAEPFLAEPVLELIRRENLYNCCDNLRGLPMQELEQVVVSLLKPSRVKHVLGCRDTAADLARHWGADETDAARAGLLHDITKALDGPLQLTLCSCYDIMVSDFSQKNPKTLHALTGSYVAQRIFGENTAVVSAIAHHTTGKANMSLLEKIIYVADYMEPNRDFDGVEHLRELAYTDLDKALKLGLQMTLQLLRQQGRTVSIESEQALAFLEKNDL